MREEVGDPPSGDPGHDEEQFWREDLPMHLFKAVGELRSLLRVDEAMLARLAPESQPHPRDFVLAQALDEIQRTSMAMLRWAEFVGDRDSSPERDGAPPELGRVILEGVRDEQVLRLRCTVEALIALVCASQSDEEAYWRHWVLLTQLGQVRGDQTDLQEFYECRSENLAAWSFVLSEEIAALEASTQLDLDRSWYLDRREAMDAEALGRERPTMHFSSTRSRLKRAIRIANPREALIMGTSYVRYSHLSQRAHFLPLGSDESLSIETVARGLHECGLAAMNLLVRVRTLLSDPPGGSGAFLAEALVGAEAAESVLARETVGHAENGDVVLAQGRLAVVTSVIPSSYGYRSYRVRFLQAPPLPEIGEDCVPAPEARVVLDALGISNILERVIDRLPETSPTRIAFEAGERDEGIMHQAIVDTWEAGLGDLLMGRSSSADSADASGIAGGVAGPEPTRESARGNSESASPNTAL